MQSIAELRLREQLMAALKVLRDRNGGFVTRDQLSDFPLGGGSYRLIDKSRGIWNPRWASSTQSVLSSPADPYSDEETHDGVLRHAYRSGGTDGDAAVRLDQSGPADCRLTADPVVFLLLAHDRVGRFGAIARGTVVPWGRRPWLVARLLSSVASV